jgi:hypothetical protein
MPVFDLARELWRERRIRRAVQRFGPVLRADLARSYGSSEHYTVAQIYASLHRLQVPARHQMLLLAGFLSEPLFTALVGPGGPGFETLSRSFLAHEPVALFPIAAEAFKRLDSVSAMGGLGAASEHGGGGHDGGF